MVVTRGNKAGYSSALRENTKRRKTSGKENQHTQGHENSDTTPVKNDRPAQADKKKRPVRVAGRLHGLLQLPLDIFYEVCCHLCPRDLLRLSRASRRFRQILMSKSSRYAWKAAERLVPGLPECPEDLSNPQYAWLMFETGCQTCDVKNTATCYGLHCRLCNKCFKKSTVYALDWEKFLPGLNRDHLFYILPFFNAPFPRGDLRTWRSSVEHLQKTLPRDQNGNYSIPDEELEKMKKEREEKLDRFRVASDLIIAWVKDGFDRREKADEERSITRTFAIRDRIVEAGWLEIDMPLEDPDFCGLIYRPTALTEAGWHTLYPKLEPFLEQGRQERIRREEERALLEVKIRVLKRKLSFETFYVSYLASKMHEHDDLTDSMFMDFEMLYNRSNDLQELFDDADVPGPEPTFSDWQKLIPGLDSLNQLYKDVLENKLLRVLHASVRSEKERTRSLEEAIGRADVVFSCRKCHTWHQYPQVFSHSCFYRVIKPSDEAIDERELFTDDLQLAPQHFVHRILRELGLGVDARRSELDAVVKDDNLQCARCPSKVQELCSFPDVLHHFATDLARFRCAVEGDMSTFQLLSEKRRAKRPTAVNVHDMNDERPLVRLISGPDHAVYAAEVEAFRVEEATLITELNKQEKKPSTDPVERVCRLCPTDPEPQLQSPGAMQLHLRNWHKKKVPNLKRDSKRHVPPS